MASVVMNGVTKHAGNVYDAGETYELDDGVAAFFIAAGWAREPDADEPTPGVPGTTPGLAADTDIAGYDRADHDEGRSANAPAHDVQPDDVVASQEG
jgi:hypothetical protein